MLQAELSHGAGPGGWLPVRWKRSPVIAVSLHGNPAPQGPGPPWLRCGPALMLLQMPGLKRRARKAAGRSLAETCPPWEAGCQEGMKLPSAEWAPRWPGSPGLAPRRPAGLMSC